MEHSGESTAAETDAGPDADLADWWPRAAARLIDGVLEYFAAFWLAVPLGMVVGDVLRAMVLTSLIPVVYEMVTVSRSGATLGMRAVSIRVQPVGGAAGSLPTRGQALSRVLVVYFLVVVGSFVLIPLPGPGGAFVTYLPALIYATAFLDRRTRRGLPDRYAHTIVVKA